MEVDRLSFFEPWPDLGAHHENQLTRAFLVVLRMCPLAHQVWLRLVAPEDRGLDLARLPSPELHTQRATITRVPAAGEAEAQPIRGISVLQSADPEPVDAVVTKSERHGIFDGVIVYGDQLAIVLEVKFVPPPSLHEVLQINVGDARVELDERARTVDWRDLLDAWATLDDECHVSGAEQQILRDFLEYVERHHGQLGPFARLRLCGSNRYRIARRLANVLEDVTQQPVKRSRRERERSGADIPGATRVQMVWLGVREVEGELRVRISMYPADTLAQARQLYLKKPDRAKALLDLRSDGWEVKPNFHLGYRQRGFGRAESACRIEDYLDYWLKQIGSAHELERDQWPPVLQQLADEGVVSKQYESEFAQQTENKLRVHPRPGVLITFDWTLADAAKLDDQQRLGREVRIKINDALQALGEAPLASADSA